MKVVNTARKAYVEIFDGWTIHVIRLPDCRGEYNLTDSDYIFTSLVRMCVLSWAPDAQDFIHWRCCGVEAQIECPTFFDQGEHKGSYLVCPECSKPGITVHNQFMS